MKSSTSTSKGRKSTHEIPKKRDQKDDQPQEEFITPDPSRSKPDENPKHSKIDKMGISREAKNQPSDERDTAKDKK